MIRVSTLDLKAYPNPLIILVVLLIGIIVLEKANLFSTHPSYGETVNRMANESVLSVDEKEEEILPPNTRVVSEKERQALYKIVEAEASSEDIIGRIMVANVIFNRVSSDRFPDNVYDVIHQRINGRVQFSPIDDKRYFTVEVSAKTREAVDKSIQGVIHAEEALFFMARSMATKPSIAWFDNNLTLTKKHGIHEFFKY